MTKNEEEWDNDCDHDFEAEARTLVERLGGQIVNGVPYDSDHTVLSTYCLNEPYSWREMCWTLRGVVERKELEARAHELAEAHGYEIRRGVPYLRNPKTGRLNYISQYCKQHPYSWENVVLALEWEIKRKGGEVA